MVVDYVLNSPNNFPLFAEHRKRPLAQVSGTIVDTGITLRAFFPMDSQPWRENTTEYHGYIDIWDMQVACMQPMINNLSATGNDLNG